MYIIVDVLSFKTKGRNLREQNITGQESNPPRDHSPYVNTVQHSSAEFNADVYSVPMEYEDIGQLDSNPTGDYHELNPMTLGVPQGHVYSSINTSPNNKASSGDLYEEVH